MEKVAILIATLNGEKHIGRTLESISKVCSGNFQLQIVVVDNGSTDHTADIIQSFAGPPVVTYLYCAQKGKSRALNHALSTVEADLLLFTDDDVEVDSKWALEMVTAAREHPERDLFGGAVLPDWEMPPPEWLRHLVEEHGLMAITGPNLARGSMHPEAIKGPNMMVRWSAKTKNARFREDIGPDGTRLYPMGSETSYLLAAAASGAKALAVPSAVVHHVIRTNQLSLKYVLLRYLRHGRGWARMKPGKQPSEFRSIAGFPLYIARKTITSMARCCASLLAGNKTNAIDHAISSAYDIGVGIELRSRSKQNK